LSYNLYTVAFYNVENLFDTINDPKTFDDDRTPDGKDLWTMEKYEDKIKNIARVISQIGQDSTKSAPAVIGLCEIENLSVLEDLVNHPNLAPFNYKIVHYDSPDKRGIDVALLYQDSLFKVHHSEPKPLMINYLEDESRRFYTRDQLLVSGSIRGEKVNIIVNHWPSRGEGIEETNYRREKAAMLNKEIIDELYEKDASSKIISMGDFNDGPTSKSFKEILQTNSNIAIIEEQQMHNPMEVMSNNGKGSLAHKDEWYLFDQILISDSFVGNVEGLQFYEAKIFSMPYLISLSGQYQGFPFRSYDFDGYTGGFSDHFPVFISLIKHD